jgi:serine O-acetyltransferase
MTTEAYKRSGARRPAANAGRPHIQLAIALLRTAQLVRGEGGVPRRILSIPFAVLYRFFALFVVGIDVPVSTRIGARFKIHHGIGLVIHSASVIGDDVTVRQGVTIGAKEGQMNAPRIGHRVNIGSGAQVIGNIFVGDDSVIGAGAVVTKSAPAGSKLVGNPARAIS